MLYHVSPKTGLKTIQPHISAHKKAYVYAIENMVTGMLFGTKHDDFDFMIDTDENDIPIICECYPNALKNIFQGKSCSVYEVDDKGFQRGRTSWESELVSENEVEVRREIVIENLYEQLLKEEQNGKLKIFRYEFNDDYRKKVASHIIDRLFRFEIDMNNCMEKDVRFATYYKDMIQALIDIMDGHLLQ